MKKEGETHLITFDQNKFNKGNPSQAFINPQPAFQTPLVPHYPPASYPQLTILCGHYLTNSDPAGIPVATVFHNYQVINLLTVFGASYACLSSLELIIQSYSSCRKTAFRKESFKDGKLKIEEIKEY